MSNQPPDQPYPPQEGQPYPPQGYQQTGNPKADAKAAKAYAKASRPWYKKKRFVIPLALVVLAVLGGALGGGGEEASDVASDSSSTDSSQAPADSPESDAAAPETKPSEEAAPKPKTPKPVAVEASAMLKEFEDNELSADAKYKGKMLRVAGTVENIDTDLFDEDKYILRISGGGDFEIITVNCNDMSTDELSTLTKGDDVTVLGEFDDGGDLGVEVKDCSLA